MKGRRGQTPSLYRAGPFIGMRDSLDPTTADPGRAMLLQNVYPLELDKPSAFDGRPGFQQAGAIGGDTNKRTGQLVYQFTKLDGTEYTVRIVGGQGIQTFNWSTRAWSTVVTVANLTTASVTLSETARCYAVTFADLMVISDGVNTPFAWDGASGAGGLTKMTNCPVIYGQPTVYYSKLFAIKNAERSTIVWSEENAVNTGYEAGGYNNAWTLGQTEQEPLYAITGTNEALYYFRARSSGYVAGEVSDNFTTDGTHEGVSQTEGTVSPAAVVYHGNQIYFLDADARPQVVVPGAGVRPIWEDLRQSIALMDPAELVDAVGVYDPTTRLVLFAMAEDAQTIPSAILVYNPVLNVPVAVWNGFTLNTMGVVKNSSGTPVLMHLGSDGYAYDHGTADGTLWDDGLNSGTVAITHAVEGPHLGADDRQDKHFRRMDWLLRSSTGASGMSVSYRTPRANSTPMSASIGATGSALWGFFNWGVGTWSSATAERHLALSIHGQGRWIRPRIAHSVLTERFGVETVSVEAIPQGDRPGNT